MAQPELSDVFPNLLLLGRSDVVPRSRFSTSRPLIRLTSWERKPFHSVIMLVSEEYQKEICLGSGHILEVFASASTGHHLQSSNVRRNAVPSPPRLVQLKSSRCRAKLSGLVRSVPREAKTVGTYASEAYPEWQVRCWCISPQSSSS
jgi:hypothetical protein